MPKKTAEVKCTVSMPDHQEHAFILTRDQTAQALMDRVRQKLEIGPEIDYFGLFISDSSPLEWLILQEALHGQLPKSDNGDAKLEFGVKFYLSDPGKMVHVQTKYLFFHQLMEDMRSQRLTCGSQTTVELCAFAVQALLGDFDPAEHTTGYMSRVLRDLGHSELPEAQIHPLHKLLLGRSPLDAEYEFLKLASEQTRYGNEFFPAVMNKERKRAVSIGVGEAGIKIFDRNTVCINSYSWTEIVTILFDQSILSVTYMDQEGSKQTKIKFKCENKQIAKAVWTCGIQKHAFFRRRRVPTEKRPSTIKRALGLAKDSPLRRSKVQNKTAHQVIRASIKRAHEPSATPSPRGGNFRRLSYTPQGTPPQSSPRSPVVDYALDQRAHPSPMVHPAAVTPSPTRSPEQPLTPGFTAAAAMPNPTAERSTPAAPPRAAAQPLAATVTPTEASSGRQDIRALGQFNDGYPQAQSNALPFSCGDVLTVIGDADTPLWWRAKNTSTNAFGVIPSQATCESVGCRGYQTLVHCQPGARLRPVMIYGPMQSAVVDELIVRRPHQFTTCANHTTRAQRDGEIPGLDYEYVSDAQFEVLQKSSYFAEVLDSNGTKYGTPFVALEKAAETAGPGVTCLWDFHHSMAVVNMIESDMEPIVILVLPDDAETVDPTTAPQEVQYALTMRSMYPDLISGTVYSSTVDGLVEQVLSVVDVEKDQPFWATKEDGCKSVALTRGLKGFGFTVSSIGNKIASVMAGSSAAESERLKVGDVIVAVNDIRTSTMLYSDLILMIKKSTTLHLKLRGLTVDAGPATGARSPGAVVPTPVAARHDEDEDLPDFDDEALPEWDSSLTKPISPLAEPSPPPTAKRTSRPPPPKPGQRTSQPRPPPPRASGDQGAQLTASPPQNAGSRQAPPPRGSGQRQPPPPRASAEPRPPPAQRQPPAARVSSEPRPPPAQRQPPPRVSAEPRPPPTVAPPQGPPTQGPPVAPPPPAAEIAAPTRALSFADEIKAKAARRNSLASLADGAASPTPAAASPEPTPPKGRAPTMEEELRAKFLRKQENLDSEYDRNTGEARRRDDAPASEAAVAAMLARVGANAHGDVAESPSPPPTQQSPTQDPNVEAARASAQAAMTAFGEAPTALNAKSAPAPPSPAVRRAPPRQQTAPPQGQPHPKFPPPPPNDEGPPPPPPPAAGRTPFAQQSPQVSTKADDDDYIEVGPAVVPDSGASSAEDSAPKTADVSTTSPASGKNQNLVSKRERIGTIAGEFDGRFTKTVDIEFTRPHGTSLGFKFGGGTDKPAKPGDPNVYITGIVEGGAAAKDGRLRVGDRILVANGTTFTGVAHRTVLSVLKSNATGISLTVSRVDTSKRPSGGSGRPASRRQSASDNLKGDGWTSIDATEHIEFKKLASGLGFSLRGGTDKPKDGDSNIYVTKISPGGAAALDGRLQVDDKIVECNNTNFVAIPHSTAIRTLKARVDGVMLVVSRRCRRYSIPRTNGVFGIGIKGGSDLGDAIHLSVIIPGSAASFMDLQLGQEISHINGVEVQLKTHAEVMDVIKATPDAGSLEIIVHQKRVERSGRLADTFSGASGSSPERLSTDDVKGTLSGRLSVHAGQFRKVAAVFPGFDSSKHCSVSLAPENQKLNRYIDILAYDHSRIELQSSVTGGNYINANHVLAEVDDGQGLRWIASQGPLEETANDFWTMVWENHVSVVCMLTKLFERRPKCYKYWPDEVEVYGDITVQIVEVEAADGYIIRSFHVTRTGEATRLVFHCQFEAWPDHGVPDQADDFLRFFDKVQELKNHTGSSGAPLLLHCSAGIGRTGVFILAELGFSMLQHGHAVDMPALTTTLREQRMGLVQTEPQYQFVHSILTKAAAGAITPASVAVAPLPVDSVRQSR